MSAPAPRPASPAAVEAVEHGLKVNGAHLAGAVVVDIPPEHRNDRGWPVHMLGAEIVGTEFSGQIGVWAIGDERSPGPIFALNGAAPLDGSLRASSCGGANRPHPRVRPGPVAAGRGQRKAHRVQPVRRCRRRSSSSSSPVVILATTSAPSDGAAPPR